MALLLATILGHSAGLALIRDVLKVCHCSQRAAAPTPM